ncbi:MAG: DNA translocase FtsK 4TM domain-containing protein [Campylobacterota bacterium]
MYYKIFSIITAIVILFATYATFVGDKASVGSYGQVLASFNKEMFGYFAYIIFLLLLIPLYSFYKHMQLTYEKLERFVFSILFLLSLFIVQALLVENEMRGFIGSSVVDFLEPFVGIAGAWLFWLMTFLVSLAVILDEKIQLSQLYGQWMQTLAKKRAQNDEKQKQKATRAQKKQTEQPQTEQPQEEQPVPKQEQSPQQHQRVEGIDYSEDAEIPDFDGLEDSQIDIKLIKSSEYDKELEGENKQLETKDTEDENDVVEQKIEQAKPQESKKEYKVVEELEENKKLLDSTVEKGKMEVSSNFKLPPASMLQKPKQDVSKVDENQIDEKVANLLEKLKRFNINGDVVRTYSGPVVTTFEFRPAPNVKVSKILNLQDDLAMALKAKTIRIQAPIPGQDVVGIEIPNDKLDTIYLRELIESDIFKESSSPLTLALGKDIVGKPFFTDLKKLPHLLIAGTTGSGKSVGINAMILSLLFRNDPQHLKLMMVDPKMLEFSIYNDIPHLLTPVITEPKKAVNALNNMVAEMERRYKLMSNSKTKNIENYNKKAKKTGYEKLPYIVVVIDELADLMMTAGKDVEYSISRLAQMARASGIHLIVATQRPSVDVVTGLIKANLPSRISYKVGQKVDSKVILDSMGAESLLGRGDMLFTPPGSSSLVRLHAPWSEESEVENIVEFLKSQGLADYDERFLSSEEEGNSVGGLSGSDLDDLYEDAKSVVLNDRKTSISYLQRKLGIGYNRSANIIEQLEAMGVLSTADNRGNREILL